LSNPGLTAQSTNKILYISGPLGKKTKANLELTINQLIEAKYLEKKDVITVTDKAIPTALNINISIE